MYTDMDSLIYHIECDVNYGPFIERRADIEQLL